MKRKNIADGSDESVLLKSLRRSVSCLLEESQVGLSQSGSKRSAAGGLGNDEACWKGYRERLSSFSIRSQLSRPKELTPVIFAKHGWRAESADSDGDDLLRCDDCQALLCIAILNPLEVSIRIHNANVRNIQRKLTMAHDLNCRWRSNEMTVASAYDVGQRYSQLEASGVKAVPLVEGALEKYVRKGVRSHERFLRAYPNEFWLLSAICGWTPLSGERIECRICGRNLCLAVFSTENHLDPLEQHHSYCPVVDPAFPLWRESLDTTIGGSEPLSEEKESVTGRIMSITSLLRSIVRNK